MDPSTLVKVFFNDDSEFKWDWVKGGFKVYATGEQVDYLLEAVEHAEFSIHMVK